MEGGSLAVDLTGDLLSRLPVRSLLRFRIVCRQWSSIMDDPYFIAAHLRRSKSLPPAITIVDYANMSYNTIYLDDAGYPTPVSTKPGFMGSRLRPTSSVNGILCIPRHRHDTSIELLNPATGESLILPAPPHAGNGFIPYLGFNPGASEYKIVCLVDPPGRRTPCDAYTTTSNGTGSWRRIQDFQLNLASIWRGIPIDGKLYWITRGYSEPDNWTITSLDLATEESSDIVISNFPPFVDEQPFYLEGLLELEAKLCLMLWQPDSVLDFSRGDMYFYVLGDDGEWVGRGSFNIPCKDRRTTVLMIHKGKVYMRTIYNEELNMLCWVDLESGNWSEIYTDGLSTSFFAHGESLVSLRNRYHLYENRDKFLRAESNTLPCILCKRLI